MAELNRQQMEALYKLFNKFALDDQRVYYENTISKHRAAASQVNKIRALLSFFTGLASAAAGLIVQYSFDGTGQCLLGNQAQTSLVGLVNSVVGARANCTFIQGMVLFFLLMAVVTPAFAAAFNILADLYQWDRLITIYDTALENIEVADARSPDPEMDDMTYLASLRAFAEGTLGVMYDETAQWGQLIRTPPQLEEFIQQEREKAGTLGGDADALPAAPKVDGKATTGTSATNAGNTQTTAKTDENTAQG